MNTATMPVPVKKCPRSHDAFVTYVRLLITCLTGNATFPNPTPTVVSLTDQVEALVQANARAKGGGPGVVADRNAKRRNLDGDVDNVVSYVKSVVKVEAADPATAVKLILSTGLSVRKSGSFTKPPLAVKNGSLPGEVNVSARAVRGAAMYFWEYSADGVTWTSTPGTTRAKVTIPGLTSGQLYSFRFHAFTSEGMGPTSDVVKCRVN